jgi:RNA polymerase II subunit A small phosphatase-like protein
MSNTFQKQNKLLKNNKFTNSKNNKTSKRANTQKKYLNSPDIITQVPKPNLYSNNFYSNNINFVNMNLLHQQALTPISRKGKYGEEFLLPKKSLKFEGKKTLVLDIDETLVHSSFFPFEKNDLILKVNFDGIFYNIYVLVRPGAEQFIKDISKYFEIITFTASIPTYASPLLDILDKGRNIQHRLYREHCTFINGVFIKDLKRLNRNLKDVIIVDNSPLAFAFDTENGLPITSWFDDPVDKELINIQPLLQFLANTKDVRQYIKQFVKNNIINYEIANKIIKENTIKNNNNENTSITENINKINNNSSKKTESNKKNENIDKNENNNENMKKNENTKKIENINNRIEINADNKMKNGNNNKFDKTENDNIKNICIIAKDIKKDNSKNNIIDENEKKDEKIEEKNSNSNNNSNNKNSGKIQLFNNYVIKKDFISPLINNGCSLNDTNKKINDDNSYNLKIKNPLDNNKDSQAKRKNMRNNKSSKNSVKNINKKNNIFRLGIKINESNNIVPISNNFSPKFKNNKNNENDYKMNDNNILMPIIFPSTSNLSKKNNYHINYNNPKNKNDKKNKYNDNIFQNNNKNKNANIISLSLKEAIEDQHKSVKQFKYINLIDKFQKENILKSSSLKIINKNNNLMIQNFNVDNNEDKSHRNNKYKLKNNINNTNNINNNNIRKSSKPKISTIINRGFEINNTVNRNKINDLYSQALRSKSTGNFVKLKSAQIKTPKHNGNNVRNNIKWINEEDNKIIFQSNIKNNKNKNELASISNYTPNNIYINS